LLPQNLPILSAAAPFKEGYQSPNNFINLAAGTIAIKDVAALYIYPNTIAAVQISGAQLRDWLERSAQIFNRIDPQNPAPQPLLNPHVPSYVFDVISGITYNIDITQPSRFGPHGKFHESAHRIINLRHNGSPITDGQNFIVITNNYRADAGPLAQNIVLRAPDQIRDVIIRYILTTKILDITTPEIWSFATIGTPVTVTFESAPAAAAALRQQNITTQGDAGNGYTTYALTLTYPVIASAAKQSIFRRTKKKAVLF
jgi:2',3'-cyclic-nucleotide 2'-phosphodiesterase/3'-nucleotidase